MRRSYMIEASVFAIGLAIGVACAGDGNAQTAERIIPDDTAAVVRLLGVVRGADPLVCEMAARTADRSRSWSTWSSGSGQALVVDSAASAVLDWVQRSHNDPALVAPLRASLTDPDACVRRIGSALLSRVRHPSAVSALIAGLDDARAGTREVSAIGLGMADSQTAASALQRRLDDLAPAVRQAAAWALGELEIKAAMPALIELLAKDPDPRVRQSAAWAIGSIR